MTERTDNWKLYLRFAVILFLSLFCKVNSQELNKDDFNFKQISYDQGLPGPNLRKQFQDSKGIIWISVEARGVCRYNGHKFTLFLSEGPDPNSISSNFINDINEDNSGDVWFATENGLNCYDRETRQFSVFKHVKGDSTSLPDNIVYCIKKSEDDKFWVGTENGLALFDIETKKFKQYFHTQSDSGFQNTIQFIFQDSDSILWLGTKTGLVKFNIVKNSFKKWEKKGLSDNEPVHNRILDIVKDEKGHLWLATHRGLDRFNPQTESFIHWKYKNRNDLSDLGQEGVNSLFIDDRNRLWVGTYTKGLVIIDLNNEKYIRITRDDDLDFPLRSNHIRYIYEDRVGIIWLGTKFEGLFKYYDKEGVFNKWPSGYSALQKLEHKYVISFYEDMNNHLWLGTKFDGLFFIDQENNRIINYQHEIDNVKSIASNRVQSILKDSKNRLWLGTEGGLDLFDENKKEFIHIGNIPVYHIIEDHIGKIWFGTVQGVYVLDEAKMILSRFDEEHENDFFQCEDIEVIYLYQDSHNYIWFSTRLSSLYKYNPVNKTFHNFNKDYPLFGSLEGNLVRPVFEDSTGNVWIGTKAAGLIKYDFKEDKITRFSLNDGMPSNFVLAIEQDLMGNLWLGTHYGLSKFDVKEVTFDNYNYDYGLKSNITELGVGYRLNDGSMLFGGNNGFNLFYPQDIKSDDIVAPILISSVKVFDKEILNDIDTITDIHLKYNQNYLSFEFTISDYKEPYRHSYKCYLEGLDDEWKYIANRNYVSYTSLDPGNYTFYVMGTDEKNKWTNDPLQVNIRISPPFFATWGFRVTIVLLVVLTGFLLYNQKLSQIKRNNEKLERMIKERTKKLESAYQELLLKNEMIENQKKEIETHHAMLESMVNERTRDLEIAKLKAEESDRLKSSFLANMSHEIRTPINAIAGFSSLLEEKSLAKKEREQYINTINDNTTVLLKLIEDILDISKIEAGQLMIKKEVFNLNSLMYDLISMFKEKVKIKSNGQIQLKWTNENNELSDIAVYSDKIRCKQILSNLINNAIKYTHKGIVEFGFRKEKKDLEFFVKDTGIGISKNDLNIIFNRFVKIEEKSALYRGTGIGLSISKGLVDLLGGKIWVESTLGKGSCFYFSIPGVVDNYHLNNNNKEYKNFKIDLQNKNILVVEDEDSNFSLINSYLKKSGVNLMRAFDGEDAVEICKNYTFDIILMDIKMPKMNGFEALKNIRIIYPEIPIIAQTAYATEDEKERIMESGFTDYLPKPIMKKVLMDKILPYI